MIGAIIGEFSDLIFNLTKDERAKNEEIDLIAQVMQSIKLPEQIQNRVYALYEYQSSSRFISSPQFYNLLSTEISSFLKSYQIFPVFMNK